MYAGHYTENISLRVTLNCCHHAKCKWELSVTSGSMTVLPITYSIHYLIVRNKII